MSFLRRKPIAYRKVRLHSCDEMKPYNRASVGRWTMTQRSGANTTFSEGFSEAERTILTCSSISGNKVDPNPQQLTRNQQRRQVGFTRSGFTTSPNYTLIEGQHGYGSNPQGQNLSMSAEVYARAVEKLYTQLRGELDLSIDLLEARQVRNMVGNAFNWSASNLVRTVRRIKRAPTSAAANLWLQYVYGWRPLANSVFGVIKTFQDGARKGLIEVKVRARETGIRDVKWNSIGDSNLMSRTIESSSKRCLIHCTYGIKDSVLNNLATFSSLNPASILWELTPWSFVVDWFVDVGGYMKSLENALLYQSSFKRGYATQGYLFEGTTTTVGQYQASGLDRSCSLRGSYRLSGKVRTVFSKSPTTRPPRFNVDLGATRLLSGAALLRQQLSRI